MEPIASHKRRFVVLSGKKTSSIFLFDAWKMKITKEFKFKGKPSNNPDSPDDVPKVVALQVVPDESILVLGIRLAPSYGENVYFR